MSWRWTIGLVVSLASGVHFALAVFYEVKPLELEKRSLALDYAVAVGNIDRDLMLKAIHCGGSIVEFFCQSEKFFRGVRADEKGRKRKNGDEIVAAISYQLRYSDTFEPIRKMDKNSTTARLTKLNVPKADHTKARYELVSCLSLLLQQTALMAIQPEIDAVEAESNDSKLDRSSRLAKRDELAALRKARERIRPTYLRRYGPHLFAAIKYLSLQQDACKERELVFDISASLRHMSEERKRRLFITFFPLRPDQTSAPARMTWRNQLMRRLTSQSDSKTPTDGKSLGENEIFAHSRTLFAIETRNESGSVDDEPIESLGAAEALLLQLKSARGPMIQLRRRSSTGVEKGLLSPQDIHHRISDGFSQGPNDPASQLLPYGPKDRRTSAGPNGPIGRRSYTDKSQDNVPSEPSATATKMSEYGDDALYYFMEYTTRLITVVAMGRTPDAALGELQEMARREMRCQRDKYKSESNGYRLLSLITDNFRAFITRTIAEMADMNYGLFEQFYRYVTDLRADFNEKLRLKRMAYEDWYLYFTIICLTDSSKRTFEDAYGTLDRIYIAQMQRSLQKPANRKKLADVVTVVTVDDVCSPFLDREPFGGTLGTVPDSRPPSVARTASHVGDSSRNDLTMRNNKVDPPGGRTPALERPTHLSRVKTEKPINAPGVTASNPTRSASTRRPPVMRKPSTSKIVPPPVSSLVGTEASSSQLAAKKRQLKESNRLGGDLKDGRPKKRRSTNEPGGTDRKRADGMQPRANRKS